MIKKNLLTESGSISTILGKGTYFNGTLSFQRPLQVSGEFEGEIISDGYLFISEGAIVRANIKANTVVVAGHVTGNVVALERLEMQTTGKVVGNIKTSKLQIADGVIFDGNCEMIQKQA